MEEQTTQSVSNLKKKKTNFPKENDVKATQNES